MSNNDRAFDDEIDLLAWLETIWNGKWKIASIIAISLLSVFGFNVIKPNTTFIAQTKIKPITSFEFDKYLLFNSSLKKIDKEAVKDKENEKYIENVIFEITPENLLNLYIEQLEKGTLLETGIEKNQFFNKDNFQNENDYREAIQKFASDIEILRPGQAKGEIRLYHVLSANYNDQDKWKQLLSFINIETNKRIKNILTDRFEKYYLLKIRKKLCYQRYRDRDRYAKKDFDKKMEKIELDRQFKLEEYNN